jgi:hypothetical protein
VRNLRQIEIITARLDRAAGTPGLLAAAWEALEFLRAATISGPGPGQGSQLFAAYLYAAAAAAEARDAAGMAPSAPAAAAAPAAPARDEPPARLAGLAQILATRLDEAAAPALPDDWEALRLAAAGAAEIRRLLTASS